MKMMENVIAIDIVAAGRTPWRNPITEIGAVRLSEDGEIDGVWTTKVAPRPGSEMLIIPNMNPWGPDTVDESVAISELSTFVWTGGRGAVLVVHDIQGGYQFLLSALNRRSASAIGLPDKVVCLKTFALLLESHKRCKLNGLSIPDLYSSLFVETPNFHTALERAAAIASIYSALANRAGWR
jgi:DNA polymerase III epsilon subunit-like protein